MKRIFTAAPKTNGTETVFQKKFRTTPEASSLENINQNLNEKISTTLNTFTAKAKSTAFWSNLSTTVTASSGKVAVPYATTSNDNNTVALFSSKSHSESSATANSEMREVSSLSSTDPTFVPSKRQTISSNPTTTNLTEFITSSWLTIKKTTQNLLKATERVSTDSKTESASKPHIKNPDLTTASNIYEGDENPIQLSTTINNNHSSSTVTSTSVAEDQTTNARNIGPTATKLSNSSAYLTTPRFESISDTTTKPHDKFTRTESMTTISKVPSSPTIITMHSTSMNITEIDTYSNAAKYVFTAIATNHLSPNTTNKYTTETPIIASEITTSNNYFTTNVTSDYQTTNHGFLTSATITTGAIETPLGMCWF